jgi:PAS domain S-box-containing protein
MESELRGVIDTLPGLIWTARADGWVDSVNQRWCDYTGLGFEEAVGAGWQATIHPDDVERLLDYWAGLLEGGQPGEIEARLRRFDGAWRWFLFGAAPTLDASGQIIRWYGINTDIDDRKRADEGRRAAEAIESDRYAHWILDSIPGMVGLMTPTGTVEFVNNQILDYFGLTLDELKLSGISGKVHPDDIDGVRLAFRRAIAAGQSWEIVQRFRGADGAYQWFESMGFPLRDADGRIVRFCSLLTNIDDRKRAEALLAGEKQLLAMVGEDRPLSEVLEALCAHVERTSDGSLCSILTIDPDGRRFCHGAGPSLPDAYNAVLDGLIIDPDYGPCGLAATRNVQAIAADVATDPRWLASPWPGVVMRHGLRSCWSTPILSGDKVIGVFALYQDRPAGPTPLDEQLIRQYAHLASIAIERKHSEAALAKVRSEMAHVARVGSLGVLSASITHEVNQPLSGIITNANTALRMLSADPPNIAGAMETARRSLRDGHRAADVIRRLRVLFANKEATSEAVDLNEAAREIIAISANDLQRNQVSLRAELDAALPAVMGDRVQLQQVILNLLLNAADAMSQIHDWPRQMVIKTSRTGDGQVSLGVRDVGVGLDPEAVDRLFEAFYTTKSDGMGMGLSVSRSIIENHGGHLWVTPNEGPGVTFTFAIPARPADSDTEQASGALASDDPPISDPVYF